MAVINGRIVGDVDLIRVARELPGLLDGTVRRSRNGLLARIQTTAPIKTGALRRGIIASPFAEKSAKPGKVVYDIYMDEKMNSTFVKYSKSGKRYYYPASQEYGFKKRYGQGKVPGKEFMKNTAIAYYDTLEADVSAAVGQMLDEIL